MHLSKNETRWYPLMAECVVILAIIVGVSLAIPWVSAFSEAQVEPQLPGDIALTVGVDFADGVFTVTNRNSFDWTNIELHVNYGSPRAYRATVPWIRPGASYTVDATRFTAHDGTPFNPWRTDVRWLSVSCDTPYGTGVWYQPWQ